MAHTAGKKIGEKEISPMANPAVAITIDDFEWQTEPMHLSGEERNRRLLKALSHHHLQAVVFVNGQYVDEGIGPQLLRTWDRAGHLIGNHTYSHNDFNDPKISLKAFAEDIWQNEEYIQNYRHFRRLFRYPFLHEGNTQTKRDGLRRLLREKGYRSVPVTITTCDWAIDDRLREQLKKQPKRDIAPYRDFYLNHISERVVFYESLARRITERPFVHTILLHYTLLNALFLSDVLDLLMQRGWRLANAGEALAEPLLSLQPELFPSDNSILWTIARERNLTSGLTIPDDYGKEILAQMIKAGL